MDKRLFKTSSYNRSVVLSRVKYGEKGSVPIDQSMSQSFNIDPATGRPMTDIQRLSKMQNDVQMQAAFSQLNEFRSNSLPDCIDDVTALKFMCPRLSQLPSELLAYRDGLTRYHLEQQQKEEALKLQTEKEEADAAYIKKFREDLIESNKESKKD